MRLPSPRELRGAQLGPRGTDAVMRWFYGAAMLLANVIGAFVVLVFLLFAFPLPELADASAARRDNLLLFALVLLTVLPAGALLTLRLFRGFHRWAKAGGEEPVDPRVRRAILKAPLRQSLIHGSLWALAAVAFTALNATYSWRLALDVLVTVVLGAAATCAVGYLLAERATRPAVRLVLAEGGIDRRTALPVAVRILLAWGLGTGVPVLGLTLVALSQLTGLLTASGDRLASTVVFLGSVALVVGLLATALVARTLADPINQVRRAIAEVRGGRTDVEVSVYDGSEIGLLQAGFNQMVGAVREREELRDLFGRQVGEDVARLALERGVTLGGEVRQVAVLFIDLVGSTELAAERPPEEVVELLNELFACVVEVVDEHHGSVNKFEGDAALCVFGAPLDSGDHAGDALAAARDLDARLRRDVPNLDVGIGVAAGEAVAGNIGAAARFEYTVIGDPVNEGARLCELAKQQDGRVLASMEAVRMAPAEEAGRWQAGDEVTLRGRSVPTLLARPAT